MTIDLQKLKNVHFFGIGGSGMSGLAKLMIHEGKTVSGSDKDLSQTTDELSKLGAKIYQGHDVKHIGDKTDLAVYSVAVAENNPDFLSALKLKTKELNVPLLTYAETLGVVSQNKFTIAVAGTCGKTTTTAMIAKIFIDAGLKPTVIVGAKMKDSGSNFVAGDSKYFIVEACEYKRSFLNIKPDIAIIANISDDHLDYFGDLAGVQKAFSEFVAGIKKKGALVWNGKDKNSLPVAKKSAARAVNFQLEKLPKNLLKLPGIHNEENARAAIAVARLLGINMKTALKSLSEFSGTARRFEKIGQMKNGALVYDDYAHHPDKVRAALAGAREFFSKKKITVVFQPHLYSRTKILLDDFAQSFKDVDSIIFAPIYAAREKNDESISSEILAEKTKKYHKNVLSLDSFEKIIDTLKKTTDKNSVIITMGAGDIYKIAQLLISNV